MSSANRSEIFTPLDLSSVSSPVQIPNTPLLPPSPLLSGSSIGLCESRENLFQPSKPILDPPVRPSLPALRMLATVSCLEKIGEKLMSYNQDSLDRFISSMHALQAEEMEKLKTVLESTQGAGIWGFLKEMGSLLLAALSSVFGLSILAAGGSALIGGALIASGILSILNFTFKKSGVWDWVAELIAKDNQELKQKLAHLLPAAVGVMTAGISLFGSAGAAWIGQLDAGQKVLSVLDTATSLATGFASFSQGTMEYKKSKAESSLMITQADLKLVSSKMEFTMTEMQSVCENESRFADALKKLIRASIESVQIIHHSV